ncbi:MAG: hypothetical protein ACRD4O_03580, partial [Bryobacteraceae bacterium]
AIDCYSCIVMRKCISVLVSLALGLSLAVYSAEPPSQIAVVNRALRRNRALLNKVSNYTCLETISREQKARKQKKPKALDVVQVDVAVGRGAEIYSWPGGYAFSSSDLAGLVGHGFLATGFFDVFANNVFGDTGATVRFVGEQHFLGRPALRFVYILPSMATWKINWLGICGDAETSGEFWIDKQSFRLIQLRATATHIPAYLPLKAMTITIDYETLSAAAQHNALIPSGAQILAVEANGTAHRDTLTFSQCHAFGAESKMVTAPEDLATEVKTFETHRETLPAGINLRMTLETPIYINRVKLGDPIIARLNKALRVSSDLTIPRDARVKGRIRQFRELTDPPNTREIGISFDEIDWPGHAGIFFAEPVQIEKIAGLSRSISKEISGGRIDTTAGLLTGSTTENIWAHQIPGVATFFLTGTQVIPKGFRMTWRTRETKHP